MPRATLITRALLITFAAVAVVFAGAILTLPHTGNLAGTTSGKVLAAALLALALGAGLAVRDPWQHRSTITVLIAFLVLSALAIAFRLAAGRHQNDPSWYLFVAAVIAPILLVVFYPRPPKG